MEASKRGMKPQDSFGSSWTTESCKPRPAHPPSVNSDSLRAAELHVLGQERSATRVKPSPGAVTLAASHGLSLD